MKQEKEGSDDRELRRRQTHRQRRYTVTSSFTPLRLTCHTRGWGGGGRGRLGREKKAEEDTRGPVSESTEGFFICVTFFSFPWGHGGYCVTFISLPLPASCETEMLWAANKQHCVCVPEWVCACLCVCVCLHTEKALWDWVMSNLYVKQGCLVI